MIPEQEIERIRDQYDIVSVIKRFIELDKNNTACCPFHTEKSGSFKVNAERKTYKCFGCGDGGDIFAFVQKFKMVNFKEAAEIITGHVITDTSSGLKNGRIILLNDSHADSNGSAPPVKKPVQKAKTAIANKFAALWESRVDNLTDEQVDAVAADRGVDSRVFHWLKSKKLIGIFNGNYAFPVFDDGIVVRCHYKDKAKGNWFYDPQAAEGTSALVIGDPKAANTTFILESQWDAFAVMASLRHWEQENYYAYIITRGASSNTDVSALIGKTSRIIAISQNDPDTKKDKEGKTPAQKWLERVKASIPQECSFSYSHAPAEFEDPNDWIAKEQPTFEDVTKQFVEKATSPDVLPFFRIPDLTNFPLKDDPDAMIGIKKRYLCKGGSMVIIGPSGAGKSTLMTGMAMAWAMGRSWNGIDCRRPLRQIIIQAENDKGDIAEMAAGSVFAINRKGKLQEEEYKSLVSNVIFVPVSGVTSADFVKVVERQLLFHRADVVWIDPVLSYIGGDISKQEVSSNFFRVLLDPMLKRTGAIAILMHHTGKPEKTDGKPKAERSVKEFAYSGLGSSDMVNWVRSVAVLMPTAEKGKYKFMLCKRESRAGAVDFDGSPDVDTLYLRQGGKNEGLSWTLCPAPQEEVEPLKKGERETLNFFDCTFPTMFEDLINQLIKVRKIAAPKARMLLKKAIDFDVIHCPQRNGMWEIKGPPTPAYSNDERPAF
jgi:energy-coupling factor transporter ATP-binding protein EcfA2